MPRVTFARDYDKQLQLEAGKGRLAVHYRAGETYDVPDELVGEVQAFGECAPSDRPGTAVPETHADGDGDRGA